MKIVFLSSSMAPQYGGAAFSESGLAGKLSSIHEVVVLSRVERMDEIFAQGQGIKTLKGFKPWEVLVAYFWPRHWLAQLIQSADLFHLNGHWFWENYFFARLASRCKIPYFLHPRGMLLVGHRRRTLKKIFNLLMGNWIVKHASRVIALSHYEKHQFLPYGMRADRVTVIPNPIEIPNTEPDPKGSERYFLYLGRIESRKNLKFLLEGFALLAKKRGDIRLKLVGPAQHHYDRQLKEYAVTLNISEQVDFLGPVFKDEKWRMYAQALAVIYPAVDEPYGRVPFEAMSTGNFALVPKDSGSAEYLKNEFGEFIYANEDKNDLAHKLAVISNYSMEQRKAMAAKSKDWISKNLNWECILPKFLVLYSEY